ncbi:hypothetical protein Agabi119p4_11498 [Agaricus bisporus var. burnettii]|uniref:Cytochrome P450 n=1 Tax=Agaricus bisporus var. burnettii TaxID=192524 RepID=A0A8H7EUI6_AGABI|nr:hypothetical protein Agabi119p4_11498 [Agaricus bisporus var. burnettii]
MAFSLTRYLALLAFAVGIAARYFSSRRYRHPPGPRPLPFVGNALQIPFTRPENKFAEWGAQYGDVVRLKVFGQVMIVLNTLDAARELLDKRSSLYSDRPRFVLFSELMGWSHATTHVRYGQQFRRHRRWINHFFNCRTVTSFRPLQAKETVVLLKSLAEDPDAMIDHLKRYAAATILKITYNRDVESVDDLFVKLVDKAATLTVESGSPAATLVDFFPSMKYLPTWLPFTNFKRNALETRKAVEVMFRVPYDLVIKDMRDGGGGQSYVSTLVEKLSNVEGHVSPEDRSDIQGSAGTLYAAAEDTTVSALQTFILAMVLNPDVYKKLQDEMDSVCGDQRLPTHEDRLSLPYLECVLKECLRWNVPVPMGLPHRLMEDDVYRDWYLSSGTTVLVNIRSILHDCDAPTEFNPERYIKNPDLPDPRTVIFGFGRRICPGRHFAEENLWSISTNLIATMDITKAIDENGDPITPPVEFTTGFVSHPKPFKCNIKPRSDQRWKLVEQTELDDYVFPSSGYKRFN